MKCGGCGRESPENAVFCESCGTRLGMTQSEIARSEISEPATKDIRMPLAILIVGIVITAAGGVIYALAVSHFFHSVTDDPFGTMDQASENMSYVLGSYAIMAIGGLVSLLGVVLLILRMA